MVYEISAQTLIRTQDGFIHKFDNNATGQVIYEGVAEPGTADATTNWQIRKYTYDANGGVTSILFADGNKNFDNSYSLRTGYTYS